MKRTALFSVLISTFLIGCASAGEEIDVKTLEAGEVSPPAKIEALAWLAGHWQGEGLGGTVTELIAPAAGGQMMGAFSFIKEDAAPGFYEFYLFTEVDDTIILKLKHFSPELAGWEEKDGYVEFPLVALEENAAYFGGLTYVKTGPDELKAAVRLDENETAYFSYKRKPLD